jgi:hypothetical protein
MAKQVGKTMTLKRQPRAQTRSQGERDWDRSLAGQAAAIRKHKLSDPSSVVRTEKATPRKREKLHVYKSKAGTRYTNKPGAKKGER